MSTYLETITKEQKEQSNTSIESWDLAGKESVKQEVSRWGEKN